MHRKAYVQTWVHVYIMPGAFLSPLCKWDETRHSDRWALLQQQLCAATLAALHSPSSFSPPHDGEAISDPVESTVSLHKLTPPPQMRCVSWLRWSRGKTKQPHMHVHARLAPFGLGNHSRSPFSGFMERRTKTNNFVSSSPTFRTYTLSKQKSRKMSPPQYEYTKLDPHIHQIRLSHTLPDAWDADESGGTWD